MDSENAATPLVDVIIAVHNTKRPLDRSVRSAMRGGVPIAESGGLRVTIVCHNVSQDAIASALPPDTREACTFIECHDGSSTCAAPRNLGMDVSTARYVSFLDSDDALEDGAIANWVSIAERYGADAVIATMIDGKGRILRDPVIRPGRRRNLDLVADRLATRTEPNGLFRRSVLEDLQLRFDTTYQTGEDVESLKIWASGGRIDLGGTRARYILHDDAEDRVSEASRPFEEDLAPFLDMMNSSWYKTQGIRVRRSFARKVIYSYLFGGMRSRAINRQWGPDDIRACQTLIEAVNRTSEGTLERLSRADRHLLDLSVSAGGTAETIAAASERRRRYGRPETLLPRNLLYALDRDAPIRYLTAAALVR
ncbi:glycosyltransferase family 2 protein [Kocuria rosea]|uniref:glycosyltransferase family 2 protein n=1 Tax=Kocuria rosea TaxID=1275 RepID=UPI0011A2E53D|nr:glycosyltransferase family A protein [Kocuria rosea]